ncbi:hypothetical protein GCM10020366_40990 [Saccharopolyspora gregorii]|uniref:Uncharacterized protein n=1 Tax=Saccharopolyspora gregorii TaxID=33914 RepID=A0ABP6RU65_9PSEU
MARVRPRAAQVRRTFDAVSAEAAQRSSRSPAETMPSSVGRPARPAGAGLADDPEREAARRDFDSRAQSRQDAAPRIARPLIGRPHRVRRVVPASASWTTPSGVVDEYQLTHAHLLALLVAARTLTVILLAMKLAASS